MERRFSVHAGAPRQLARALAVLVLASSVAAAAPKKKAAKKQFDRGVALYTKGDYVGARDALAASFGLESDVETLFAWAQAERQLGNCPRAIELYEQLLDMPMPSQNKSAIRPKIDECRQIIAEAQPAAPVPPPEPTPAPAVEPTPSEPAPRNASVAERPDPREAVAARAAPEGDRLKHPVGIGLVAVGAVGLGVGGYYLWSAAAADGDADAATNYFEYVELRRRAESQGKTAVLAGGLGAAFTVAGIIWYATRAAPTDEPQLTGWVAPDGGGIAAAGRF